jgi:Cys-rich repeat protein
MGGCLPCECPAASGICVVVVDPTCTSDADCRDGQFCGFPGPALAPCLDADNNGICDFDIPPPVGTCIDLPVSACSTDADCADGEFCSFGAIADPNGRIAPPQGTCEPLNVDPCADVRCEAGTTCAVDASGQAVCIAEPTQCNADVDCAAGEFCFNGVCSPPIQR